MTLTPIKLDDIGFDQSFCFYDFDNVEWVNCTLDEHDDGHGNMEKVVWMNSGLGTLDELPEELYTVARSPKGTIMSDKSEKQEHNNYYTVEELTKFLADRHPGMPVLFENQPITTDKKYSAVKSVEIKSVKAWCEGANENLDTPCAVISLE